MEGLSRCLVKICMVKSSNVAYSRQQWWSSWRRNESKDSHLLNADGERFQGDIMHGVPFLEVMATINGRASAVQPV
ncbi:hypothetical protein KXV85_010909, partial [Aspergillus fumigatus]